MRDMKPRGNDYGVDADYGRWIRNAAFCQERRR